MPRDGSYRSTARQSPSRPSCIKSSRPPGEGDPLVTFRYDQAAEFIDAIVTNRPCMPSFLDGARAQAVMDAAIQSNATRGWVDTQEVS